eukprot:2760127-Pyramimonas_sp.AAC.1
MGRARSITNPSNSETPQRATYVTKPPTASTAPMDRLQVPRQAVNAQVYYFNLDTKETTWDDPCN